MVHLKSFALSRGLAVALALLGAVAAIAIRASADPPTGGELLVLDRDSDLGGTHCAVLGVEVITGKLLSRFTVTVATFELKVPSLAR